MRQRNQRYSRPAQRRAYNEGFRAGYDPGNNNATRKAGRNPRIWAIGRKEGREGRQEDLKSWDFVTN
jgi:hypothetical protein